MKRLLTVLTLICSLACSLLVAELLVRTFLPQRLYYNVSQWDPYVGFIPIPGLVSQQRTDEYDVTVAINSRGLRDREFALAKPDKTVRIGIFGDSFTFGQGVEVDQTYPKLLEELLLIYRDHHGSDISIEVLNFGIGKTGTSHQLAWYQKEGQLYSLDIVVVGFLAGNDFGDNLAGVFRLRDGELIHNPTAYSSIRRIQAIVYSIPGYRWLSENSHLVNLARRVATRLHDKSRKDVALTGDPSNRLIEAVELTKMLIAEFQTETKQNNSDFLLLSFPKRNQPAPPSDVDPTTLEKTSRLLWQLQQWLMAEDYFFIDFVPVFEELDPKTNYFEVDGHWRAAGHAVVAERLFDVLSPVIWPNIQMENNGISAEAGLPEDHTGRAIP